MLGLDRFETTHHLIVFGVAQLGIVEHVITIIVAIDLIAQARNFRQRILLSRRHRKVILTSGIAHCVEEIVERRETHIHIVPLLVGNRGS